MKSFPFELEVKLVVCSCKHSNTKVNNQKWIGGTNERVYLISEGDVVFIGIERGSLLALVELSCRWSRFRLCQCCLGRIQYWIWAVPFANWGFGPVRNSYPQVEVDHNIAASNSIAAVDHLEVEELVVIKATSTSSSCNCAYGCRYGFRPFCEVPCYGGAILWHLVRVEAPWGRVSSSCLPDLAGVIATSVLLFW